MVIEIMKYLSEFVDCIQDYIERENITIKEFSKRINLAERAVAAWINLKYFPLPDSAIKVADFLNCSLDYLFGLSNHSEFIRAEKEVNFLDRFEDLCKKKNVTHYQIAKVCKFGESMISKWKKGKFPKCETLIVIAKYFECSIDYLIGRADTF